MQGPAAVQKEGAPDGPGPHYRTLEKGSSNGTTGKLASCVPEPAGQRRSAAARLVQQLIREQGQLRLALSPGVPGIVTRSRPLALLRVIASLA